MARYSKLMSSIWADREFVALTAGAQRLYMLLLSQPDISTAGVLPLTITRWAHLAPDTYIDNIQTVLSELHESRFVFVDEDTEELCIRTYIRHDAMHTNPNGRKSIEKALAEVLSDKIRTHAAGVLAACCGGDTRGAPVAPPSAPSDGGSEGDTPPLHLSPSPVTNTTTKPIPGPDVSNALTLVEPEVSAPPTDPVGIVFDAWRESTLRKRSELSQDRRRLIRKQLGTYPLDDLVDAVRGWKRSPFHCGKNDDHAVHNDIELLLRNAAHIEKFRDLERQELSTRAAPVMPRGDDFARELAERMDMNGQERVVDTRAL